MVKMVDFNVSGESIFYTVFVFMWLTYLWESYLSYRQRKIYRNTKEVPRDLTEILDKETFDKARLYQLDKSNFGFWYGVWNQLESNIILLYGFLPMFWNYCGDLMYEHTGLDSNHEVPQTIVFTFLGSLISTFLDLPWSIYSTFVLEQKHGFNKQTVGFYIKDKLKKFIVNQVIMIPIVASVVEIIAIGGEHLFLYLWLFTLTVSVLLIMVYADYIAPLFDKFNPLPDGELRTKIEELAASINFPLTKLYVVEGSKRSAHSNAYFYGFFKNKRIVLFDTLLEDYTPFNANDKVEKSDEVKDENGDESEKKEMPIESEKKENEKNDEKPKKKTGCNNDEVVAVLAHELGHWKHNHILKNFFIGQINTFILFLVFGLLHKNQILFDAFGFYDSMPLFIGLIIIFQFIYMPYHEVLGFLLILLSRQFEFQADRFAKSLRKASDLRSSLIKLNKDNLEYPIYDWLYSTWHHSHPPLLQRLEALDKCD